MFEKKIKRLSPKTKHTVVCGGRVSEGVNTLVSSLEKRLQISTSYPHTYIKAACAWGVSYRGRISYRYSCALLNTSLLLFFKTA